MEIVQFVAQAGLFGIACGVGAFFATLIVGALLDAKPGNAAPVMLAMGALGSIVSFLGWLAWGAP